MTSPHQTHDRAPIESLAHRSVLIVDDEDAFTASFGRALRSLGYEVSLTSDYPGAQATAERDQPFLIISELRVRGRWAFDEISALKQSSARSRFAIVTNYPSVATAVRSVRTGFDAYVVKPVEPRVLLELVGVVDDAAAACRTEQPAGQEEPCWPSLDRTIWEHINQVFVTAGSMSEAARRLRLDRRSLRRMLAKYPPVY